MKDQPFLSIVIPARNEQELIASTIENILPYTGINLVEIIVVDDHSTDDTSLIVKKLCSIHKEVKLVYNQKPAGFANALKTGFENASGEFVLPVMADGCDDPKTIPLMIEKAKSGYDLICGCRYMKGAGKIGGPKLQGFFSRFVCLSLYYLARFPTRDISNAFKAYRRSILQDIRLKENGFAISMEAAMKFCLYGYRICDVPTFWVGRKKGKSKFRITRTFPYMKLYIYGLIKSWTKIL